MLVCSFVTRRSGASPQRIARDALLYGLPCLPISIPPVHERMHQFEHTLAVAHMAVWGAQDARQSRTLAADRLDG
jgi:hypothetical protein